MATFEGTVTSTSIQGTWKNADGTKSFPFLLNITKGDEKVFAYNFVVNDGSPKYTIKFSVETCEGDECRGNASIKLIDKTTHKLIQVLYSEDLFFYMDKNKKPTTNIIELYGEQSPFIFDDFNFDGNTELAVRNGNNSGYGGPSYDVYLFAPASKEFVLNDQLTTMATENLGMFSTDHKNKRLTTFTKSGCCWHQTSSYVWRNNKPIEVYKVTEDATGAGEYMSVITETLVNGKWNKKVKTYKTSDYYKE